VDEARKDLRTLRIGDAVKRRANSDNKRVAVFGSELYAAGSTMQPIVLCHMRARSARIHLSWAALLGIEPVATPLAEPQVLVHQFEFTLNRIFDALKRPLAEPCPEAFHCPCGLSPFLAYYRAAEQALLEALVLVHAQQMPESNVAERAQDVADLKTAVRSIGGEEIALFGSVCRLRKKNESCGRCSLAAAAVPTALETEHLVRVASG
jgi:hypothetical protein